MPGVPLEAARPADALPQGCETAPPLYDYRTSTGRPVASREALADPRDAWFAARSAVERHPPERPVEELAVEVMGLSAEPEHQKYNQNASIVSIIRNLAEKDRKEWARGKKERRG